MGWAPDEGWFILTNLSDLESAILAYKNNFGIEEMCETLKVVAIIWKAPGSQEIAWLC